MFGLAIASLAMEVLAEIITGPGFLTFLSSPSQYVSKYFASRLDNMVSLNRAAAQITLFAVILWSAYSAYVRLREIYTYYTAGFRTGVDARRMGFIRTVTAHPSDPTVPDRRDGEQKERDKAAILKHRVEALKNARSANLLLASGFNDIGTEQEPGVLYNELKKCRRLRVLVLDPSSQPAFEREKWLLSEGVIRKRQQYRQGIGETISNLQKLTNSPNDVQIRVYRQRPAFRMVLTESEVWVQGVDPRYQSGQGTLTGFCNGDHSMYHAFAEMFDKKWEESVPAP